MSILYSRSYHIHIAQVLYRRIDQLREFLGEQDAATQRNYGVRSLILKGR